MTRRLTITKINAETDGSINLYCTADGTECAMGWPNREAFDQFILDTEKNVNIESLAGFALMKGWRNNRPFDHADYIGSFVETNLDKPNPSITIKV